ncbi:MAG: hypothetical protein ACI9S8_000399 [Chlamydiales bacterium]|jgi:hypothetical protein
MVALSPLDIYTTHSFLGSKGWSRDILIKSLAIKGIVPNRASLDGAIQRLAGEWRFLLEDSAQYLLNLHTPDELRTRLRAGGTPLCNARIEEIVIKSLRMTKAKVAPEVQQFNVSTDAARAPSWATSAMYLPRIPALVHYQSTGLSYAGVIGGIRLPLQSAWSKLPNNLKASLGDISEYTTEVCVVFNDVAGLRDKPHANLFYHAWQFPNWSYGDGSQRVNLAMGIFSPTNVSQAASKGISVDALSPQSVNPHDHHLSPDNARLVIEVDSSVSSFFAVAKDDSNKNCIITQHIVLNDNTAGGSIERVTAALENSGNLFELTQTLPDLGVPVLLREDELEDEAAIFSSMQPRAPLALVDKLDAKGRSPLINAASVGQLDRIADLLDHGADKTVTYKGLTAYQWAKKQKLHEAAALLKDASIEKKDGKGRTSLINAASSGNIREVVRLLQEGADLTPTYFNRRKGRLMTASQWAKDLGFTFIAGILKDPFVDRPDAKGRTPLICAASVGDFSKVAQLLSSGADVTITYKGRTAFQWAERVSALGVEGAVEAANLLR